MRSERSSGYLLRFGTVIVPITTAPIMNAYVDALAYMLPMLLILSPVCRVVAEGTNQPPPAMWDTTSRLITGIGYRENILRSRIAPESSAFFNTSADVSLMRFAESGAYVSLFILFDNTHYFDAPSVDYEQFFSAMMQAETPVGQSDALGGQLSYFYQHQVFDLSETETLRTRMLVDGCTYTLSPYWRHTLGGGWAIQAETTTLRQLYRGDISDYWAPTAGGRLIRRYGHRSEVSANAQFKSIEYDSRSKFDDAGLAIPDTKLVYRQKEIGGRWQHNFDKEQCWRATSKLSYMVNQDNGSGYFDYSRILLSQQFRWKDPMWEIKTNARCAWYSYSEQKIGDEQLARSSIALDVRVERRLGKRWVLYALAEHEWCASNDALEQYKTWTVGGGAGIDF